MRPPHQNTTALPPTYYDYSFYDYFPAVVALRANFVPADSVLRDPPTEAMDIEPPTPALDAFLVSLPGHDKNPGHER